MKYARLSSKVALVLAGAFSLPALATAPSTFFAESPQHQPSKTLKQTAIAHQKSSERVMMYQVFTRLFGNDNTTNQPWGSLAQNGSGKFSDINEAALKSLKDLGMTHIWYTGVLHHASLTDYPELGIQADDADVVKGLAGSPYAIRDYYNVNPYLADNPAERLKEFKALVSRTHAAGLKVIIDLVPNHVARDYQSLTQVAGARDFGADDNTQLTYARDNNFYYIPNSEFQVPKWRDGYQVLGGQAHASVDGKFAETPAKWTGNGSRSVQPDQNDWYETVKLNYGVKPDGSYDFPRLPEKLSGQAPELHAQFWQGVNVPSTWQKFDHIAAYWQALGVDGFRFDVAELVPVEFWSYLNSQIKARDQDAFLVAEIYQPPLFRDYLHLGQMDSLYNKTDLYDTLKPVIRGEALPETIIAAIDRLQDVDSGLMNFLENHDEQRLAHPDFAGSALRGLPAMTVSATVGSGDVMLYFGQELGEAAMDDAGFGKASRSTIFDYWGIDKVVRWNNQGQFNQQQLTTEERELRQGYQALIAAAKHPVMLGDYQNLHQFNLSAIEQQEYAPELFSYARWTEDEQALIVTNFSEQARTLTLKVPAKLTQTWGFSKGTYAVKDLLANTLHSVSAPQAQPLQLEVKATQAEIQLQLPAYGSSVLLIE